MPKHQPTPGGYRDSAIWKSLTPKQQGALTDLARGRTLHRIRAGWTTGDGRAPWLPGTLDALVDRNLAERKDFAMHITARGRAVFQAGQAHG